MYEAESDIMKSLSGQKARTIDYALTYSYRPPYDLVLPKIYHGVSKQIIICLENNAF
jgi:hypothetical protein